MLRKYALLMIALSIFLVQGANATKIGFFDYDQAVKDIKKAQEYLKELEAQEAAVAAWEQKVKNEMEPKMKAFQDAMPKWSEEKRKTEEAKLSKEIADIQQESAKKRQKLASDQESKLNDLKTKINEIVKTVATKSSYDVILNHQAAVFISEKIKKDSDITKAVVDEFNKKYPGTTKNVVKPGAKGKATPTGTTTSPSTN